MSKRKTSPLRASAEAVFGSASRGDADRMSDRDYLIVDDDPAILRARSLELAAQGWSVASYTFAKLHALAELGALFIQHLKLESEILNDKGEKLKCILDDFLPKKAYRNELLQNKRLAKIASVSCPSDKGVLLSADILYVAVRNYGIIRLAERGIHIYAYNEVVESLEENRMIKSGGAAALANLRFMKCLYRDGEVFGGSQIRRAVDRAFAALPAQWFPQNVFAQDPLQVICARAPNINEPPYLHLRDLERRLVAFQCFSGRLPVGDEYELISRWVTDPRVYSGISKRLSPRLRGDMRSQALRIAGGAQPVAMAAGI